MAKITLKRNNGGTADIMYPTTTSDQLFTADGSTAIFSSDKLKAEYLPDSVFGGMKFVGTVTYQGGVTGTLLNFLDFTTGAPLPNVSTTLEDITGFTYPGDIAEYATAPEQYTGYYWIIGDDTFTFSADSGVTAWASDALDDGDDTPSSITVEPGDWVIISGWDATLNSSAGGFIFSVVNNTYRTATTSAPGIMSAADKTKLDGIATNANNYSLPLAANGTRGGIQIGYTNSESNRAVVLASEQAYITLPRVIPNLSVNGTTVAESAVSVYAPTTVGSTGQIVMSDGDGAPNWVDHTAVVYGEYNDAAIEALADGTIVFETDN